jgi:EAL and modified HD-GYP domain-containing signal transduction protein
MNAPDRLAFRSVLGALSVSYSPLIDRARRTFGTRLTMLSLRPQDRLPVGLVLDQLGTLWPEASAPVLVAPLDAEFDHSLLDWEAPSNAILELPSIALRDPQVQGLAQRARRKGIRLAMRGRPDVPLPPALLACFDYAMIHVTEDRRRRSDGTNAPPPPGVTRRMPFIITGCFRRAELDAAYERGAMASVGVPLDEDCATVERPPQPAQSAVLELLRLAHERAALERMEAVVKHDAPLAFELLRHVGSSAFAVAMPVASLRRALLVLGPAGLTRWLSRLLRVACDEGNAAPLMHASIRRALFLEHLASCVPGGAELREALYLTGAFSLLDRTTGTSFTRLFERAAVPPAVAQALIERAGPCAPFLALVEAIERSDPINSRKHREALGIDPLDCNIALLRALAAAPSTHGEDELAAA